MVNYTAKARGTDFIASTFYIKNNGELIGMLCLNTDTTIITNFMKAAHQFVGCLPMGVSRTMGETITGSTTMVEENLDVPIVSFAESIISKTIADSNIPPERMTRQEKNGNRLGTYKPKNSAYERCYLRNCQTTRTFRIHCVPLH